MEQHHTKLNERKILATGGIVIFVIIVIIAYFEWRGRHHY
jgi:preprotein translocase subunit SecF